MRQIWHFLGLKSNRERMTWLGGGATVIVAGLWAAFVYFVPPSKGGGGTNVDANCGSVAVGGSVTGSTMTASGNCPTKPK